MPFMTIAEAAAYLGLSPTILRRMEETKEFMPAIRTRSRHRRYSLAQCDSFQNRSRGENVSKTVCYAFRQITRDNRDSLMLAHQLTEWCETQELDDFEVVVELAVGLNFKKTGLLKVIGMVSRREINHFVMVDPGIRLDFLGEPVHRFCERHSVKVTVLSGNFPWQETCH